MPTIAKTYQADALALLRRTDQANGHDSRPVTLDGAALAARGVFGFDHEDPRSHGFMMLRSQILRRLDRSGHRIIAVTSTQPGNGKSFVASNLAAALSQIHPTCLIDLDLRRPVIAERFGIETDAGVDGFLLGEAPLALGRYGIGGETLAIGPVGRARSNSADILASAHGAALFEQLRALEGGPVCFIDTPPALEGDDMMILTRHVDGILLVVEEGKTRRAELRQCLDLLHPTPIIGTVLNRVILSRTNLYGQYNGYHDR